MDTFPRRHMPGRKAQRRLTVTSHQGNAIHVARRHFTSTKMAAIQTPETQVLVGGRGTGARGHSWRPPKTARQLLMVREFHFGVYASQRPRTPVSQHYCSRQTRGEVTQCPLGGWMVNRMRPVHWANASTRPARTELETSR